MQTIRFQGCLVIAFVVGMFAGLPHRICADPPRNVLLPTGVTDGKTLSQNWTDADAEGFYNLPQGSKLIRYNWFLYLEQPDKETLFRDAEHIRSLGYLPRQPGAGNPKGLPVGFVQDGLHVGLTCAACHTTQIVFDKKAWLIDGAPTLGDFETLMRRLADALKATLDSEPKFTRFAEQVLGAGASDADRAALRAEMKATLDFRQGYNARNLPRGTSPRFGPARLDAFGAIFNEVSSTFAGLPDNHAPADAPVSYPFLWDTPQHDFVQWNGAVENTTSIAGSVIFGTKHIGALGRNAGEVLGVFGTVHVAKDGAIIPIPATYPSSVNLPDLIAVEESLRKLWSPQWPKEFPPIDPEKRTKGEDIFKMHCVECHQPIDRMDPNRTVKAWLKKSVGTDPTMARNFLTRKMKTGAFQGQLISVPGLRRFGSDAAVSDVLKHTVERVLLGGGGGSGAAAIRFELAARVEVDLGDKSLVGRFQSVDLEKGQFLAGHSADDRYVKDLFIRRGETILKTDLKSLATGKFSAADGSSLTIERWSPFSTTSSSGSLVALKETAPLRYIYKGRPLNGIWATAPYLHNGSVPNLDELLKKPEKRLSKFSVGSQEFDPVRVGFRSDIGNFVFDTALPGNSNAGHDYNVEFTQQEREQLVEYLKSL
jgi:mono/diheme cytochrome c family protein